MLSNDQGPGAIDLGNPLRGTGPRSQDSTGLGRKNPGPRWLVYGRITERRPPRKPPSRTCGMCWHVSRPASGHYFLASRLDGASAWDMTLSTCTKAAAVIVRWSKHAPSAAALSSAGLGASRSSLLTLL